MKLMPGRNQFIIIVGSLIIVGAGAVCVANLEQAQAQMFLNFLADYGKWAIGFATVGSAGIKMTSIIKNGKQPPK
jgi:hypothetical protein